MSTNHSTNSRDPQRGQRDEAAQWDVAFLERVMRYQDGTLTGEQFAEFDAELRTDEGKRRAFAELQMQSAVIHETLRCDAFASDDSDTKSRGGHVSEQSARGLDVELWSNSLTANSASVALRLMRTWGWSAVVIGLLVAVLLTPDGLRRAATRFWPGKEIVPPESNSQKSSEGFVQLARTSEVRWGDAALKIGDRLAAGRVQLVDGTAEFNFDNGVRMVLTGPAEIELRDAMHAWLHSGQVVFRVPPTAIGFTVETTEAAIVDLGTEFGVRARDATDESRAAVGSPSHKPGTELQVYEGEVIAELKSDRAEANPQKRRIHGGQALQISGELEGGAQDLPFWPERFVHFMPDPREHPDAAREHSGRKTSRYNKARHESIQIVPAPAGIVIDGSLADWDLSGRFSSACEPPWSEFYNLQGAMMFDDEHLYIGGIVADPFPMRSTVSPAVDRELYGGGGCVALRISTDRRVGWPVRARGEYSPKPRELLPEDRNDRLTFVVLWYYAAEQLPCLHLKYGMDFHDRLVNPPGYRGAWKKHADGLGYTVEYAIPWSLLHAADDPPRSGDTLAASWLVHWSDSNGRDWRGHLIDIVNPAEKGWDFQNAATWGRAVYGSGK
jgi:hypothetical protein